MTHIFKFYLWHQTFTYFIKFHPKRSCVYTLNLRIFLINVFVGTRDSKFSKCKNKSDLYLVVSPPFISAHTLFIKADEERRRSLNLSPNMTDLFFFFKRVKVKLLLSFKVLLRSPHHPNTLTGSAVCFYGLGIVLSTLSPWPVSQQDILLTESYWRSLMSTWYISCIQYMWKINKSKTNQTATLRLICCEYMRFV